MSDSLREAMERLEAWLKFAGDRPGQYVGSTSVANDDIRTVVTALRATADAAPVADKWQPIETAPKDGTTFDVWRDGTRETVYWGFPPHCCGEMGQHCDSDWHSLKEPGWICSTFGEYVGGEHDPFTHWKPQDRGPLAHPPATDAAPVAGEGLGRFGHHPEADIDYGCEVDELIAMAYDRLTGMEVHPGLEVRIRKAMDFRTLETPLELRWLNQHFNGAREVYAKMPDCIAKIAHKVPALSHPPATDTAQAEPVGLREIVERFCDWVARADDETDDCDYLNGNHPDQMIDERDGWDDLRDIRDSALAVLSTPPARTDEGEG